MKTPSSIRVKMRKNDISEESKKKSVKLTPIKKNSKESKQFLMSDFEDEEDDFEYNSKKELSTDDYFDNGDDEDFDDFDEDDDFEDEDDYEDDEGDFEDDFEDDDEDES